MGVWGSYVGFTLNCLAVIATFYVSLFPLGGKPDAEAFFQSYLAGPMVIALYLFWKLYSREWKFFIKASDMDVTTGMRLPQLDGAPARPESKLKKILRSLV